MKFSAQNTMEIITAVAVVAIIAVAVFMFTNTRNENLAQLTKVTPAAEQSGSLVNGPKSGFSAARTVAKIDEETAGSMANVVANSSKTNIINKLSKRTSAEIFSVKSSDGEDIVDLANRLIDELDLGVSKLSKSAAAADISADLINTLTVAKAKLSGEKNSTFTMFEAVLGQIMGE